MHTSSPPFGLMHKYYVTPFSFHLVCSASPTPVPPLCFLCPLEDLSLRFFLPQLWCAPNLRLLHLFTSLLPLGFVSGTVFFFYFASVPRVSHCLPLHSNGWDCSLMLLRGSLGCVLLHFFLKPQKQISILFFLYCPN